MQTSLPRPSLSPAFALPAVLLLSAGILILLVTLMTIVELERTTSKARAGSYQADLAVESGFEEAKQILAAATASDSYAVGVVPLAFEYDDNDDGTISSEEDGDLELSRGERGRSYLYAIQGEVEGGEASYRMTPLFATHEGPASQEASSGGELTMPTDPGLVLQTVDNLENHVAVQGTPFLQAPVTAWRIIRDENEEPIARYSYWVEDMQGYLDAEMVAGNERRDGKHARANEFWEEVDSWNPAVGSIAQTYIDGGGEVPLWPAPGMNPAYIESDDEESDNRLLSEVAVYTLDQKKDGVLDESDFDDILRDLAPNAPTPASLLALAGAQAPLERVAEGVDRGRLELGANASGTEPRWIEESFVTGNRSWEEFALIPFTPGMNPSMMGELRMNLNQKLQELAGVTAVTGPDVQREVVEEMATHIAEALPTFASERRGGFGDWEGGGAQDEAYLKNIAASIIDYADLDGVPTMAEGEYRGIDSYPMITEHLITHTYDSFERRDGANFIVIETEFFAELWNMSNHPITGEFQLGYSNPYTFEALGNPGIDFMTPLEETIPTSTTSWSNHSLGKDEEDGRWYSAPQTVTIPPNGYTLISTGVISNHLLVSPEGEFLLLPIELSVFEQEETDYRLKWNDVLCDRSGAGVELTSFTLSNVPNFDRVTKASIPGTWGELRNFYSGMYDPRQSWWAGLDNPEGVVSENSYPQNYSPGRRTVRYGSIASFDEDALHGRMLVSEWPDGGHDASFDLRNFHGRSDSTADRALAPDSTRLYTGNAEPESTKAPIFLSNLGRYFSESELGNIYDPLMWRNRSNPSDTNEIWFHESADVRRNNNVPEVEEAGIKATVVGGGNTLRIGRPEHARFDEIDGLGPNPSPDEVGTKASRLLDLFHCGEPMAESLEARNGDKRLVEGHVNVNTAPREVLRALAAGILVTDPEIGSQRTTFDTSRAFAPVKDDRFKEIAATEAIGSEGGSLDEAGAIADAIIAGRPFLSRSQLAGLLYPDTILEGDLIGRPVFGNKLNHDPGIRLQVSDRASEEVFSRVYNSTTVRSRNFRIHVIGQALEQTPSGNVRVKATRKKSYRVFVDPGAQDSAEGEFNPEQVSVVTTYESNL